MKLVLVSIIKASSVYDEDVYIGQDGQYYIVGVQGQDGTVYEGMYAVNKARKLRQPNFGRFTRSVDLGMLPVVFPTNN